MVQGLERGGIRHAGAKQMTRPADQLDIVSELEESERAYSTAKIRAALQSQGADDCHDCGDTIPPERRKAAPLAVIWF